MFVQASHKSIQFLLAMGKASNKHILSFVSEDFASLKVECYIYTRMIEFIFPGDVINKNVDMQEEWGCNSKGLGGIYMHLYLIWRCY